MISDYSVEIIFIAAVSFFLYDIFQNYFKKGEKMTDEQLIESYIELERHTRARAFLKGKK